MKPKRPDSAKSRTTQQTLDTQLNQSKFSQTFTSHNTFHLQKKDQFKDYLQKKDPQFVRNVRQSNLPIIPQKPKQQLSKINSKPFDRRNNSKIMSSGKKIQQKQQKSQQQKLALNESRTSQISTSQNVGKWTLNQPVSTNNGVKKQNKQQLNSTSKSFAEKNKQKMNTGLKKIETTAVQAKQSQKKIDLKGFKVNMPGAKRANNKANEQQSQANQFLLNNNNVLSPPNIQKAPQNSVQQLKKPQKTQQEMKRQQQLLQISRFINEVEMKNIDYYPDGYEQFVQKNESHTMDHAQLEKINIQDFLNQPTQKDYQKIQKRIKKNQQALLEEENLIESRVTTINESSRIGLSTQQTSIDLDKMLDGDSEMNQEQQNESSIFLSSISAKDLKERNLFLTQVLKGRVTKEQITKLEEMQKSQIKMMKLEDRQKDHIEEDDLEIIQINMMKKKSNRLLERNIIEASGQIYRDCDYLSEENKQRLEKLLNGQIDQSPFEASQWERFAMRRIDQGIRLYRQFGHSIQNSNEFIISEECLPKDPNLRKQAQKKILKDKIDYVNQRLRELDNIVVNKTKIQAIIEQNSGRKISQASQSLILQKNKEFDEVQLRKKQAIEMIQKMSKQRSQIQKLLREMQNEYKKYEEQCKNYEKLSVEQIKKVEEKELNNQRKKLESIESDMKKMQEQTQISINKFHRQMENQIQILKQIENMNSNKLQIQFNYHEHETIQELDSIFNEKVKNQQFSMMEIDLQLSNQNKENIQ